MDHILDASENRKGNDKRGFIYIAREGNSIYKEVDTVFVWYDNEESLFSTTFEGEVIREKRDREVLKDIHEGFYNNERYIMLKGCQMHYFLHGDVSECRGCSDIDLCFGGIKDLLDE